MYVLLLLKMKDLQSLDISLIVAIGKLCSRLKNTVIKVKFYFFQLTIMGKTAEDKNGERAYNLYTLCSVKKGKQS